METTVPLAPTYAEATEKPLTRPASFVVEVSAARIVGFLTAGACLLLVMHLVTVAGHLFGLLSLTFYDKFYFDRENNFPSLYSAFLLLTAGGILGFIAAAKRQAKDAFAFQWQLMGLLFFVLALDEALAMHELMIDPIRDWYNFSGALRFPWVIGGGLFLLAFVVYFFRFFRSLTPSFQRRFILAGGVYVLGVVGLEMLGGLVYGGYDDRNATYMLIMTLEETLEMAGALFFISTLLQYIKANAQKAAIQLS